MKKIADFFNPDEKEELKSDDFKKGARIMFIVVFLISLTGVVISLFDALKYGLGQVKANSDGSIITLNPSVKIKVFAVIIVTAMMMALFYYLYDKYINNRKP